MVRQKCLTFYFAKVLHRSRDTLHRRELYKVLTSQLQVRRCIFAILARQRRHGVVKDVIHGTEVHRFPFLSQVKIKKRTGEGGTHLTDSSDYRNQEEHGINWSHQQ